MAPQLLLNGDGTVGDWSEMEPLEIGVKSFPANVGDVDQILRGVEKINDALDGLSVRVTLG